MSPYTSSTKSRSSLFLLSVVLLAAVAVFPLFAQTDDLTGREIVEKQRDRHGASSEIELQDMLLVDSNGNKEKRTLKRYSKEFEEELYRYLLIFTKPDSIRGTTLMTWQNRNAADDQWLLMPALGNLRRIAQGSRTSYFMGSDYTYEDLYSDDMEDFTYTRLEDGSFQGQETYRIKAEPANESVAKKSGYSKRIIWIRKDITFTTKVKYFGKEGNHIKTQEILEAAPVDDRRYRGKKSVMNNKERNHKTLILTHDTKINPEIPNDLFSKRSVKKEQLLYRDEFSD